MRIFFCLLFVFLSVSGFSQIVWTTVIGDTNKSFTPSSIIENSEGEYLVASSLISPNTGGLGDVYVSKLDANGNQLWEQFFYLPRSEFSPKIVEANDSGYLIAAQTFSYQLPDVDSSSDILLIKIDEQGKEVWKKPIAAHNVESIIPSLDDDGYFLGGRIKLPDSAKSGPQDYYDLALIKVDNSGNELWRKHFGSVDSDYNGTNALIQILDSIIIMGGKYVVPGPEDRFIVGAFSNSGNFLWQNEESFIDSEKNNSIDNFMELNGEVIFFFKNAYSLDAKTGQIRPYQSGMKHYLNVAKQNYKAPFLAALELNTPPKMLLYDKNLTLIETKNIVPPNTFRILGKSLESTSDGGYIFLYRWEIDEFGPYPNRNVIRIVKTDCNGNSDQWQDCALGQNEEDINAADSVSVYPNPFNESVTISVNSAAEYIVYDGSGRKVQSGSLHVGETAIDASELFPGFYTIQVNTANGKVDYIKAVKSVY